MARKEARRYYSSKTGIPIATMKYSKNTWNQFLQISKFLRRFMDTKYGFLRKKYLRASVRAIIPSTSVISGILKPPEQKNKPRVINSRSCNSKLQFQNAKIPGRKNFGT